MEFGFNIFRKGIGRYHITIISYLLYVFDQKYRYPKWPTNQYAYLFGVSARGHETVLNCLYHVLDGRNLS
jgi:hypothetical protein